MIERKLIPCEPDDPHRCQAQGDVNEGQCKFLAVEGQIYCPKHGGTQLQQRVEKKKVHDYRLQLWQERLDEFTESDNVKNIRGEIGVLRLCLENILNMADGPNDLMLYSGKISDLVVKIEKCVVTCDKFETKVGMLLDKSAAMVLAGRVVEVIGKHVTDTAVIDAISSGIVDILADIGSIKEEANES